MVTRIVLWATCFLVCASSARSAATDSLSIRLDVMADVVYSYSMNRTPDHQRVYTTQPSRNAEVGLMLGHIGVIVSDSVLRARLALQEGWFTRANYVGPDTAWRMLQEASIGVALGNGVRVDAGVMMSHIGYESMIPRSNLVLSRNITSDYTPYYETGAMVTWDPSSAISLSALVLNGWQQIVDVNNDLSFGSRLVIRPDTRLTFAWNTYLGNDQPDGTPERMRFHNNVWIEWRPTDVTTLVFLFDVSTQERPDGDVDRQSYLGLVGALEIAPNWRGSLRAESYADPDGIYLRDPTGRGLSIAALSAGLDHRIHRAVLLRAEVRSLFSPVAAYPSADGLRTSDTYMTLSASVALP